jgi:carboxymethylenebutenolidase
VRIELPDGTPAELAVPDGPPRRGVALAPDIGGLRPLFDDLCARLAATHGWAVCAPEPFPGREALALEERLATPFVDARSTGALTAAADHLSSTGRRAGRRPRLLPGRHGGVQGGGTGRFDRAVSFYGMIREPDEWSSPGNVEPLDALASTTACPTLAIVGGRDRWTPADDVAALRAVGDHVEVVVFPEAEHGFVHDPARPAHRPDDAARRGRAWPRSSPERCYRERRASCSDR